MLVLVFVKLNAKALDISLNITFIVIEWKGIAYNSYVTISGKSKCRKAGRENKIVFAINVGVKLKSGYSIWYQRCWWFTETDETLSSVIINALLLPSASFTTYGT